MPIELIGIVDDDPDVPVAVASLIRSFGYEAECFGSAQMLLESDKLKQFKCIISDVHMPIMSGLQLVAVLKQMWPDLPVILMTGRLEQGLREQAMNAGASAFVNKPFCVRELLDAIMGAS